MHSTLTCRTIGDGTEKQVPGIELAPLTTVVWHLADWAILKLPKLFYYTRLGPFPIRYNKCTVRKIRIYFTREKYIS